MKKVYVTIILFIFLLSFNVVNANTINSIEMDIYIDNSGDAHITEVWNCSANKGTEVYHTYNNLGNSKIENFTVKDENDILYESLESWNVNASFEEKKYKSGLKHTNNRTELCFGISEYNKNKTYTANYTITDFVSNLTDSQMIYWTLLDISQEIGKCYIKIHSDFEYADTVGVWGFGNYGGTAYVYDGYIEMQSPGNLEANEYMTILVQFPQNTFEGADNNLNNNFEYYLNMAKVGSIQYSVSDIYVVIVVFFILFFTIFIVSITAVASGSSNQSKIITTKESKILKEYKEYYRDIPCNKDLFRAYYIAYEYSLINRKTDLLGAVLLKWLKDGVISVSQKEVGLIKKKKEKCIIFNKNKSVLDNESEKELFVIMWKASKDGILEKKEFEKWAKKNYENFLAWFEDVIKEERQKLVNEGILREKEFKTKFAIAQNRYEFINKEYFYDEAKKLKGLRNYLKNYTLIHEREAIEVKLFEEYLIMAQIFGIYKSVIIEFRKLYPELVSESVFKTYDDISYIHDTSYNTIQYANEAYTRADMYKYGGEGYSADCGGGGSFGGGGGGFR